jgi:hypothetical protein
MSRASEKIKNRVWEFPHTHSLWKREDTSQLNFTRSDSLTSEYLYILYSFHTNIRHFM